jgi:hypothetical protein
MPASRFAGSISISPAMTIMVPPAGRRAPTRPEF